MVLAILAALYFAAGKIGLRFASINPSATAIWAPAGVALGACLFYDVWVWPAIFVGAFLVNVTTAGSFATSIAIALGNTLEALLGAYLVRRFANGRHVFDRATDAFTFVLLGPILSTTVAATIGVTSLCLGGFARWSEFAWIWLTWWLGDAGGDLLFVPLILTWGLNYRLNWSRERQVEAVLLLLSVTITGGMVFGGWLPLMHQQYPLDFLCLPALLWAAFRFGPRETVTVNFASSCIAVVGTLHGYGPFARGGQNEALLLLQTFAGVTQIMAIAVATEIARRHDLDQSHAQLAAIVGSSDDAIVSTTLDGTITSWNSAAERLFGYDAAEAIGKPIRSIIPAEHRAADDAVLDQILKGHQVAPFETVRLSKSGARLNISLTTSPVRDTQGAVVGVSRISRDISAQRRAREEREALLRSERMAHVEAQKALSMLRRLQTVTDVALSQVSSQELMPALLSRLRAALDADAAAILLADPKGLYLTPTSSIGLREELRTDRNLKIPFGQGIAGKIAVSDDGLIFDDLSKVESITPFLQQQLSSLAGAPLRVDGRVIGAIHVGTRNPNKFTSEDLRLIQLVADRAASAIERTQLHEQQRAARDAAEAANNAKDEFLAMLSHELRNPLHGIALAIQLLRNQQPGQDNSRIQSIIARQVEHITRLVDDLLDVARVTTGKIVLRRIPLNVADCVSECINGFSETGQFEGRILETSLNPVWIEGDADRLTQIVTNLLTNAVKYTTAGAVIRVTVGGVDEAAVIRIDDTGIGIPADALPHVFELFSRGDTGLDRSPGGLGIGLTLVKRLAELHGGTAEAFSDGERRGSSFVIRIPQIAPPSTSARAGTEEALRIDSPRRVLIVEDNADAREGLCQLLQLWNFEVHEAVDGPSGVEKAEAARPDVVLVDIGLPGFDGFEVARRIRSHFGVSRIRLIAVTGYAQSEYQQRAQEAGFDEYLVKPVAADKLIHLIGLRAHH